MSGLQIFVTVILTAIFTVIIFWGVLWGTSNDFYWYQRLSESPTPPVPSCPPCKCPESGGGKEPVEAPPKTPIAPAQWFAFPGYWSNFDGIAQAKAIGDIRIDTLEQAKEWVINKLGNVTCPSTDELIILWAPTEGNFFYGKGPITSVASSGWETHVFACQAPVLPS